MLNSIENSIVERESVVITLDEKVATLKRNRDASGAYIEGNSEVESTEIILSAASLRYQMYNLNPSIALLRALRGKSLSFPNVATLLTGAEIDIDVTRYKAGDVDAETGVVFEHDYIKHTITKLVLSETAQKRLNQAIDKLSDLCL